MAAVTPLPFVIGLLVAVGLFAGFTYLEIRESRRPVRWRTQPVPVADEPPVVSHLSHARVAVICVIFALWSVWATARPVSGWR